MQYPKQAGVKAIQLLAKIFTVALLQGAENKGENLSGNCLKIKSGLN
jgi:hypothetical protein